MHALSSSETLALWERGTRRHPLDRALLAVSFAERAEGESVADWTLGRRNRALLELHAACFGSELEAWAACPQCDQKVEFELDVLDLDVLELAASAVATTVEVDGLVFRLPTSRDLAHAAGACSEQEGALRLLEVCRVGGAAPSGWTDEVIGKIGESLALADPMAETQVALACPGCGHQWNDSIDVANFVWTELEARARRLLWEVHALASAYGWTESETLSLSAARRAMYLEMVGA